MVLTKKDIIANVKAALKSNNTEQMHKAAARWEKFNTPTINLLDNLPTELSEIITQKKNRMEWEMLRNYVTTIVEWEGLLSEVGHQIKYGYHTPEYFFRGPGLGPEFIPACRGNEIFERKRLLLRARDQCNFHNLYKTMFDKIIELSTPELIKIGRMRQNTSAEQIKTNPLPNRTYTITELRLIMKRAGLHIKSDVTKEYLYAELSKVLSEELSAES